MSIFLAQPTVSCSVALLYVLVFAVATPPARAAEQPVQTPQSTPTPLFTYFGVVRDYYFGRTNGDTCLTCKPKGAPDATAFNMGGYLHGQINIPHTPFSVGATYFGAFPFSANAPGPLNNSASSENGQSPCQFAPEKT